MIHDITVPAVAAPRRDGHAQFGTLTQRDAAILQKMGAGNKVAGNIFTVDGQKPHFPSASDHFPDVQTNVVALHVSMGACQRAWVLSGVQVPVNPPVDASTGRDADDR